ncbi:translation elongation factor Ts [Nevskia soli]|jgi:elongation factor Ts|uniref:translation elongation factor Ts n=1 Tax=Nevskia soli TaxID=418856 RepID=UPI0015D6F156|nr:translation elongation factor Ts [Nevskia soli]
MPETEISAHQVKQLRDRTGAGMMECKAALKETNGDMAEAEVVLRKKGIAAAHKKSNRTTQQGVIATYIHPGGQLGVLVEVNCESDFVARTEEFVSLTRDLAMHIAAANPLYLRKEDVLPELVEKEIEIARDRAINEGKPQRAHDAIIKGRLDKFYEEVCLLEQPFVKDSTMTIDQIVKSKIAKLKENITIARFTRYKVGDGTAATVAAAE